MKYLIEVMSTMTLKPIIRNSTSGLTRKHLWFTTIQDTKLNATNAKARDFRGTKREREIYFFILDSPIK
jgi:hypothetical protein